MTRVLVVEDEESYADALSYMLRKEGYDVSLAATGPDALAEFDRNGADIVLLDLMLPGLPGTEVCRQIRAVSTRSSASSSAPTTTSPSRTRRASWSPGSARCSAAAPSPTSPR
jgi:DNA-binding response OmpR family regulator